MHAWQAAGSDRVREAQKRLEGENRTLRAQLLETEAALLAEQENVAELRLALAELRHREATPPKADQAVQVHHTLDVPSCWCMHAATHRSP